MNFNEINLETKTTAIGHTSTTNQAPSIITGFESLTQSIISTVGTVSAVATTTTTNHPLLSDIKLSIHPQKINNNRNTIIGGIDDQNFIIGCGDGGGDCNASLSSTLTLTPKNEPNRLSRKKAKKLQNKNSKKRNSFLSLSSFNLPNNSPDLISSNSKNNNNNNVLVSVAESNGNELSIVSNVINTNDYNKQQTPSHALINMELNEMQGVTKRNVIIHKDSRGYGMRISGDNPVFIQHVNEEGAAYKAGVRSGDQIIKVNGTLVTKLGHAEVVKMIQSCGTFVGLTLLSKNSPSHCLMSPTNSPTPQNGTSSLNMSGESNVISNALSFVGYPSSVVMNNRHITGPQPVPESTQQQYQVNQIRLLQEMLYDENKHLEELRLIRADQTQIERCMKRIKDIQQKLELYQQQSNNLVDSLIDQSTDFINRSEQQNDNQQRILTMDDDVDEDAIHPISDLGLDEDVEATAVFCDQAHNHRHSIHASSSIKPSQSNPLKSLSSLKATALNQQFKSGKRDSKCLSFFMLPSSTSSINLDSLYLNSLRLCRYSLQCSNALNVIVFHLITKYIFPSLANTVVQSKPSVVQRWANHIIATFITKDSPLFFQEFAQENLENFETNLKNFMSGSSSANPFEPLLDVTKKIVEKHYQEFTVYSQLKPEIMQTSPKNDLQVCLKILLNINKAGAPKLELRELDVIIDDFLQAGLDKLTQTEISTIATLSSLVTIGQYLFNIINSKHVLLVDSTAAAVASGTTILNHSQITPLNNIASMPSSLNPLLKLSSEQKKSNQKRSSSMQQNRSSMVLPASFLPSKTLDHLSFIQNRMQAIEERSHHLLTLEEMSQIIYCASCMLPLWGDSYTLRCSKCFMSTHFWCRKSAALNFTCNDNFQSSANQQQSKQRRAKQEKSKSMFGKITGKRVPKFSDLNRSPSCSSSSLSDTISSASSSSDFEDTKHDDELQLLPLNTCLNQSSSVAKPANESISNLAADASSLNQSTSSANVNRSGSFVQKKKTRNSIIANSPRKRSDPALTSKQMSTTSSSTAFNPDADLSLTSARSSGALMNSASVGAHDSQFRSLTGQKFKKMTASDSSLLSAAISKGNQQPINSPGLSSTIDSLSSSNAKSSTSLTTSSPRRSRHRNTNDSAIQMDESSENDDEHQQQISELSGDHLEQSSSLNQSRHSNDEKLEAVPPSSSSSVPPPLPPRTDSQSEKRRQIQMEILQTESEHYDVLRYIRHVYIRPLRDEKIFTRKQIEIIFGNIKELKRIHKKILNRFNSANRLNLSQTSTADIYHLEEAIFDVFCGSLGTQLELEASKFCVNKKIRNGSELWNQRKKDSRLKCLLDSESRSRAMPDNPLTRLGLDDLLSRVFQRPLRYPLLFERLLKSTPKDTQGYQCLEQALINCRRSGERINEATRKAEQQARLGEIIRKTDFSNFSSNHSIENQLSENELLHEGSLTWRITKSKLVDVHLLLTNQIIVVLTKESSDRYLLKAHINPTTKHPHKPDIKMDDLLMRDVATDTTAFFLVSKNQDIIYEFAAPSSVDRNKWKDVITKAIDEYKINHPPVAILQTQKSTSSTKSMPEMRNFQDDIPPPLPPPSILNRPLPKPPVDSVNGVLSPTSSPPPPPPPPSHILNRPLPKLPISEPSQPRFDGLIQYATSQDCHPSSIDLVQFNQVKINSEPQILTATHRSTSKDLKEVRDNIENLISERRRSGLTNCYQDLEKEIQEMSLVFDVAKHDDNSKETVSRLITSMFRKAFDWAHFLVEHNSLAKQELLGQVGSSVESFIRSYIDPNFNFSNFAEESEYNGVSVLNETFSQAHSEKTSVFESKSSDDNVDCANTRNPFVSTPETSLENNPELTKEIARSSSNPFLSDPATNSSLFTKIATEQVPLINIDEPEQQKSCGEEATKDEIIDQSQHKHETELLEL